jgi:basic amino acid/polyamine antiporter, APA family
VLVHAVLERRLSRLDAFAIALGGVIGVGVFRATGLVVRGAGGFTGATATWLIVGVVCLAGSVMYADLAARVPEVGGPYAYVRVAFGRPAGFAYGWLSGGIAIPVRNASVIAVIGELLARGLGGDPRLLASIVLCVLVGINLLGVRAGALTQRVFTAGKLLTIAFVIGLAAVLAVTGSARTLAPVSSVSIATAIGAAWYTYLGWQDVVLLAEEVREPRDLSAVLVGTVAIVIVLYTAIHLAVYAGLHGDASVASDLPALEVATRALGTIGATVLSGLMLASMIGGAAEGIMVRPRVVMALARDGLAPAALARVGAAGAPYGALLFQGAIVLALVATGSFVELLPLLVFAQGCLGVFESASYFVVLHTRPAIARSRFHPWAPIVFSIANVALCVLAGIDDPLRAAIVVAAIGLLPIFYFAAVKR